MTGFPQEWWRDDRPLVFGHRGASHAAPQNTLAAFRAAAEVGADGVELDVYLTADGVPVVIHDEEVSGTTDGSGYITEMTLPQVKELDAGATFGPTFVGERIPTLEEVMAEVGDRLLLNIELKPSPRQHGLEEAVAALVERMGMTRRLWFSSFRPYLLYTIRKFASDVPCGMLYDPMSFASRFLGGITPHEALHPQLMLIRRGMVRRTHRRGMKLVAWTVDGVADAERMADWGVDVVITNEPARLLAAYAERGRGE